MNNEILYKRIKNITTQFYYYFLQRINCATTFVNFSWFNITHCCIDHLLAKENKIVFGLHFYSRINI